MDAASTRILTAANFRQTAYANDNVLVYFWAPKYVPCDVFAPTYEASAQRRPDVVHGKVNFETEQDLVKTAKVELLPTFMAFKKGKLVFKQGGIANPHVMDNLVRQLRSYRIASAASLLDPA